MILGFADHATASLEFGRQIAAKFGSDPNLFEDIRIQCLPVTNQLTGEAIGHALAAYPRREGAQADNMVVVCYGSLGVAE